MSLPPLPKGGTYPAIPALHFVVPPDPPGARPLLVPGTTEMPPPLGGVEDWMRSPNCPNNPPDCRISITASPVTTPTPDPIHDGMGDPVPPLVVAAVSRGSCTTCNLEWDITRGPVGPNEQPITPVGPPVLAPLVPS